MIHFFYGGAKVIHIYNMAIITRDTPKFKCIIKLGSINIGILRHKLIRHKYVTYTNLKDAGIKVLHLSRLQIWKFC